VKVTKYPQSCLVVEADNGARLLLDPGLHVVGRRQLDELGSIDAVLYTHEHPDHFDERWVGPLLDRGVPLHTNAEVCAMIGDGATTVAGGTTFEAAGVPVAAYDLPHMPLVDGRPGPPNLGYLVDGRLLHPGDATDLGGLTAEVLATPIAGPSCSVRDAYVMVERAGARVALPIHYDNFLEDPALFAVNCDLAEVMVLDEGETIEL
jgi:L-ascorbate metabolism protein UlaG (beta-lactamase superfamily)